MGASIRSEVESVAQEQSAAAEQVQSLRAKFAAVADEVSEAWSPDEYFEQVQDKLTEVRDQIVELQQALLFEKKLDG
ncbi:hypothetical protein [Nevskia soli]|uniref:hypothetical protein n=1 Tax=Nevskia soli TaxID=418856 RepID=UPI0004A6D4C4|nr:hypothetical protein [Nevskia soli]